MFSPPPPLQPPNFTLPTLHCNYSILHQLREDEELYVCAAFHPARPRNLVTTDLFFTPFITGPSSPSPIFHPCLASTESHPSPMPRYNPLYLFPAFKTSPCLTPVLMHPPSRSPASSQPHLSPVLHPREHLFLPPSLGK